MSVEEDQELNQGKYQMHVKVQAWAADKTTGNVPILLVPSINYNPEEAAEGFKEGGKFDLAYKAYRDWYLKNNPRCVIVSEVGKV